MKRTLLYSAVALFSISSITSADTFGTGENEFEIEFMAIYGDSNDLGNWPVSSERTFSGVNHGDYRIGKFEVTNDQWNKFKNEYGTVYGNPTNAYDQNSYWTEPNVPTNMVSWYEAAQFVNWLNTSTSHAVAYKFTGTQGTGDYTLRVWNANDTGYDPNNPYRNSNAYYFLPTENEWLKAAYWNATSLQGWATVGDVIPTQSGWNFYDDGYATDPYGPWDVGSGSEELNSTYDMMGNVMEWTETQFVAEYVSGLHWYIRGGGYTEAGYTPEVYTLRSDYPVAIASYAERNDLGFRVASIYPGPTCFNPLSMDANHDCKVDFEDFVIFVSQWLSCGYDLPKYCWNE